MCKWRLKGLIGVREVGTALETETVRRKRESSTSVTCDVTATPLNRHIVNTDYNEQYRSLPRDDKLKRRTHLKYIREFFQLQSLKLIILHKRSIIFQTIWYKCFSIIKWPKKDTLSATYMTTLKHGFTIGRFVSDTLSIPCSKGPRCNLITGTWKAKLKCRF